MSLAHFGPGLFLLGLAALAGGLFLAQRLRVRHRRVPVVTGLFWDEAREESRARVLVRRFRHPWAYALILAIAGLTWWAAAGPQSHDAAAPRWTLYLEAHRGDAEAFLSAREQLVADLAELPAADREVLIDDGQTRRILAPGEDAHLVHARLEGLSSRPAASRFDEVVDDLIREAQAGREIRLLVYGQTRLDAARRAGMPETMRLSYRGGASTGDQAEARIDHLGLAPAASGAWDRVDLLVTATAAPTLTLDGAPLTLLSETAAARPSSSTRASQTWFVRDLPAEGGLAEARLEGREAVSLVLPQRRVFGVRVAPKAPAALGQIVDFDPGLEARPREADLDLGFAETDEARPGLRLRELEVGQAMILRGAGADALASELGSLLAEYSGGSDVAMRVLAEDMAPGTMRDACITTALLSGAASLEETAALPILVSRTLRWLGGAEDYPRFARAGEALAKLPAGPWLDAEKRSYPTLGAAFVPQRSGIYQHALESDRRVAVAPAAPPVAGASDDEAAAIALPGAGADWIAILVLIVLALLGLEWALVQRGRMP
jgi:hypothetical protein